MARSTLPVRALDRAAAITALALAAACSSNAADDAGARAASGTAAGASAEKADAPGGRGGDGSSGIGGVPAGVKASSDSAAGAGRAGMVMAGGRAGSALGGAAAGGAGGMSAASAPSGAAGVVAAKGELYSDDFEDGDLTKPSWIDGDPEQGAKWMVVAADGGKVLAQTASVSDWVFAAGGDYRWTDQVVEARIKITSEPGKAGIFARVRDTRNYYFLYIDGGSSLVLRKRVDNSSGDIQKTKVETKADTWYTLKLSVIGDAIQGSLDGKMLVSGTDSGVSSGGIGVGTADCTAQFDDLSVHDN